MLKKIFLSLFICFLLNHIYAQDESSKAKFVENELLIWLQPDVNAFDFSPKLAEYGLSPKKKVIQVLKSTSA